MNPNAMMWFVLLVCCTSWLGCQSSQDEPYQDTSRVVQRTQSLQVADTGQRITAPFGSLLVHYSASKYHLLNHRGLSVMGRLGARIFVTPHEPGRHPWRGVVDTIDLLYKTNAGRLLHLYSTENRVVVIFQHDQQDTTYDVNIYVRSDDPLNRWKLEHHLEIPRESRLVNFYDNHLITTRYDYDTSSYFLDVYTRQGNDTWQLDRAFASERDVVVAGDGFHARLTRPNFEQTITITSRGADGAWSDVQSFPIMDNRFNTPGQVSVVDNKIIIKANAGLKFIERNAQGQWFVASTLNATDIRDFEMEGDVIVTLEGRSHIARYKQQSDGQWLKTHDGRDLFPLLVNEHSKLFKLLGDALYIMRGDERSPLKRVTPAQDGSFQVDSVNPQSIAWEKSYTFAKGVAMSADALFVGDPAAINHMGEATGVVHLYDKIDEDGVSRFRAASTLEPPDDEEEFGYAVTYHNDKLLVRAGHDSSCRYYLYTRSDQQWVLSRKWMSSESSNSMTDVSAMSDLHIVIKGRDTNHLFLFSRASVNEPWPETPFNLDISKLGLECRYCQVAVHGHQMTIRVTDSQMVQFSNQTAVLVNDPTDSKSPAGTSGWSHAFDLAEYRFSGSQHLDDRYFIAASVNSNQRFIYVYDVTKTPWTLTQTLTFESHEGFSSFFSVHGDLLVAWAYRSTSIDQQDAGQAIIFERTDDPNSPWQRLYTLTPRAPYTNGSFSLPSATNGQEVVTVMAATRDERDRQLTVSLARYMTGKSVSVTVTMNQPTQVTLPVQGRSTAAITCEVTVEPEHGQLTISEGVTWTYTPNAEYAGSDLARYTCTQSGHSTGPWAIKLTVEDNARPIANPQTLALMGDTLEGVLMGSDPEGEPLRFELVGEGAMHGDVTLVDAQTGAFSYVQTTNAMQDAFEFRVFDGTRASTPATVTISRPVGAAPKKPASSGGCQCGTSPTHPSAPWLLFVAGLCFGWCRRRSSRIQ